VERIREDSRESFASSVSGTDLIVGARTSPVNLLLSSVFGIGNATNSIRWESYRRVAARPEVAWTIPLSLGDSHRGFRVLGTTQDYFDHYHYGANRKLELRQGKRFVEADDAVLGADVAEALRYQLGQQIVIAHGSGDVAFALHREHPFRVVGILARTGTPVDRAIHVSLDGMDAVHSNESRTGYDPLAAAIRTTGPQEGSHTDEGDLSYRQHREHPRDGSRAISAILIGLKSRGTALFMQRQVNEFSDEPLTAILPGVTLLEVWEIVAAVEKTLLAISTLVVVMGLAGMLIALLTGLSERRREMAVLRAVGARPWHVFALIVGEAAFLTLAGIALGIAGLYLGLGAGRPWLEAHLGLFLAPSWPSAGEFALMMLVGISGVLIGLIPAYRIYRLSLVDGMTIRM